MNSNAETVLNRVAGGSDNGPERSLFGRVTSQNFSVVIDRPFFPTRHDFVVGGAFHDLSSGSCIRLDHALIFLPRFNFATSALGKALHVFSGFGIFTVLDRLTACLAMLSLLLRGSTSDTGQPVEI